MADHSSPTVPGTATRPGGLVRGIGVSLLLALSIALIYAQVLGFDFINLDDYGYVYENAVVSQGLTREGLAWALGSVTNTNWHPLTWISLMLDVQIFGVTPGMHHLVNVIIHTLNTLMLFYLLHEMTGNLGRSAAVAALFAVHPLHVESVAWIAERKDVLSTLFWLLTLVCYLWYVRRPSWRRYLAMAVSLTLGLATKPMLVTLPFALLLLDFWPLGRWQPCRAPDDAALRADAQGHPPARRLGTMQILLEKTPLLAPVLLACVMTVYAQGSGGAITSLDGLALSSRLANATVAYVTYLWKMVWPHDLAVFYPYPSSIARSTVALSCIFLLLITGGVLATARKYSYLVVGWFWYLGTLAPVIGIVQVGAQALADRYTYIPLTGVFIMLVWGLGDILAGCRFRRTLLPALILFLPVLMWAAWVQTGLWRNSETLYRQCLAVTRDNYIIHYNLSRYYIGVRNYQRAMDEGRAAVSINPDYADAQHNLGVLCLLTGDADEALRHFLIALRIEPHQTAAYHGIGAAYMQKGDYARAINCFDAVRRQDPNNADAMRNIEIAERAQKKVGTRRTGDENCTPPTRE